jgi:hypothetical protein
MNSKTLKNMMNPDNMNEEQLVQYIQSLNKKLKQKRDYASENKAGYMKHISKLNIKNLQIIANMKSTNKETLINKISKSFTNTELQQIANIREEQRDIKNVNKKYKPQTRKLLRKFINTETPIGMDNVIKMLSKHKTVNTTHDRNIKLTDAMMNAIIVKSALHGRLKTFLIAPSVNNEFNLEAFLSDSKRNASKFLQQQIQEQRGIKANRSVKIEFRKYTDGIFIYESPHFLNKSVALTHTSQISSYLDDSIDLLMHRVQEWESKGSGWQFVRIVSQAIDIVKYTPVKGSSYIDLPVYLKNKKAIINVKNLNDNECFKWAVLASIHPVQKDADRITKYKDYTDELIFTGIEFPVKIDDIAKFEKLNVDISVSVYGYEHKDGVFPILISKKVSKYQVNLMFINEGENSHYSCIKDFGRLLADKDTHKGKLFHCFHCLHGFTQERLLDEHKLLGCAINDCAKAVLPVKGENDTVEFKNYKNQLKIPFVIYADFECITKEINTCSQSLENSFTEKYQEHEPCGYGYKIVSSCSKYNYTSKIYRGENTVSLFLKDLMKVQKTIFKIIQTPKTMIITQQQEQEFKDAVDCNICGKELKEDRVRDHDHISGLYRGATHNTCNINFNLKNINIPVVIHNLKGYDSHLIIQGLTEEYNKIKCIPLNPEKYLSFDIGKLKFIDSFSFMATSLEKLVENLPKKDLSKTFINMKQGFSTYNDEDFSLLVRKGVYPYDYMNSFDRFNETLPSKESFYSKLTDSNISDEDYTHAQNVFHKFGCKNMGDYHDLYLKTDVLLLADVFENFRD